MNIKLLFALLTAVLVAATPVVAAESEGAYAINAGDVLQISVWGEDTLQKEVRVLPDGSISFPLAGRVEVSNVSTPEVEKRIGEKLKAFLPDPQVTVIVSGIEGNRAYIIGKVLRPGPLPLTAPLTILQALSLAGGMDKFANTDEIKILRKDAKGQATISVNYDRLIKGQDLGTNVILNAGDTILVP